MIEIKGEENTLLEKIVIDKIQKLYSFIAGNSDVGSVTARESLKNVSFLHFDELLEELEYGYLKVRDELLGAQSIIER